MNNIVFKKTNNLWKKNILPEFTIITSVHNRKDLLARVINSVENQTYKDIEYIIIDNASTESLDELIESYMESASIPVMFIKRDYGPGPHTGRNSGIECARGRYLCIIDSDDELTNNAILKFHETWNMLSQYDESEYAEVVSLCITPNGDVYGDVFPDKINEVQRKLRYKKIRESSLEHFSSFRVDVLKKHLFPEPDGVSYVSESTIWDQIHKLYSAYCINEKLRVFYTETPGSLSKTAMTKTVMTDQHFINYMWQNKYRMLHEQKYNYGFKRKLYNSIKYNVCKIALRLKGKKLHYDWVSENITSRTYTILNIITWLPSIPIAILCMRGKMKIT